MAIALIKKKLRPTSVVSMQHSTTIYQFRNSKYFKCVKKRENLTKFTEIRMEQGKNRLHTMM